MAADEPLIGMKETARMLGVSPFTFRDWIRDKQGPPGYFIRRAYRYRRSEVLRWIEDHRI